MERQKHGFDFQTRILQEIKAIETTNYTDKWDGYIGSLPISVKCIKKDSSIDMADVFRNSKIDHDFLLIIGFYTTNPLNPEEIHYLYIKADEWQSLFDYDVLGKVAHVFDTISNDVSDDERWQQNISILKNEWKQNTKNIIALRFKRDHKTQKRVQCAINKSTFYDYFIPKYEVTEKWVKQLSL